MKPFNFALAKQGHPVCTRAGYPVRIICTDRKNYCHIVALIKKDNTEIVVSYPVSGSLYKDMDTEYDLMMDNSEYEGWINLYRHKKERGVSAGEFIYPSEESAKSEVPHIKNYVATCKIKWEEQ